MHDSSDKHGEGSIAAVLGNTEFLLVTVVPAR